MTKRSLEELVKEAVDHHFASSRPTISLVQLVTDARADGYKAGYEAGKNERLAKIVGKRDRKGGIKGIEVGNGDDILRVSTTQSGII